MSAIEEHIGQEINSNIREKTLELLNKKGPKLDKVLLRLRQSLNAKETKLIKIKGATSQDALPKGFDLITSSGLLSHDKDGKQVFGTGDSIIKFDMISHNIRLRAVDLALQLHDAMPSQKHEHQHSANPELINAVINGLPEDVARQVCSKLAEHISSQRNRAGSSKKS